ncbi:Piwi domain-containing protein [Endozoicomonas sp. ALC066]|uniref:Piwi domain-containing protein n=1 Tax=Endozoicomonas sp. ALC066 TaxID=3403078 RepID=UPI003BB5FBF9
MNEHQVVLDSNVPNDRSALERLLNQDLLAGVRKLVYLNTDKFSFELIGNLPVLLEAERSPRIKCNTQYLTINACVTLRSCVLPDGRALVFPIVRHQITPEPHMNLDWVMKNHPNWLNSITKVRHRYRGKDGKRGTGVLEAIADFDPLSPMPGTGENLIDYHCRAGNLSPSDIEMAKQSQTFHVLYGKQKKSFLHLGCLLLPVLDFDTLSHTDPLLLKQIMKNLKWPMNDRIRKAAELTRLITAPSFGAKLQRLDPEFDACTETLNFKTKLLFSQHREGLMEKEVFFKKAWRSPKRNIIVPVIFGTADEQSHAKEHILQIRRKFTSMLPDIQSVKWVMPVELVSTEELSQRLCQMGSRSESYAVLVALGKGYDYQLIRNIFMRHNLPTQFFSLDHKPYVYKDTYYGNTAAGLFSKAGGQICVIENMPGDTDLFVGLDTGGISIRAPAAAFLFARSGVQMGWQIADLQAGEKVEEETLVQLIQGAIEDFRNVHCANPTRICIHRDGKFYEPISLIQDLEEKYEVPIDVVEVIKGSVPRMYRKAHSQGYVNPVMGDVFWFPGLDEAILATCGGRELGGIDGQASVQPVRVRKRYGETPLKTLCMQIIMLTKIHGSSLYKNSRLPVTTHHADKFATLRQNCNVDDLSRLDRMCPIYL